MLVIATLLAARLYLRNITSSGYCLSLIMTQVDPNYPSCRATCCAGVSMQIRHQSPGARQRASSISFVCETCPTSVCPALVQMTSSNPPTRQPSVRAHMLIVPALVAVVSGPADFWKSMLVQVEFPTGHRV